MGQTAEVGRDTTDEDSESSSEWGLPVRHGNPPGTHRDKTSAGGKVR